MKKTFFFLLVLSSYLLAPLHAQRPHQDGRGPEKRLDITEIVSDLSSSQKSKLETLTGDSKKRVEALRTQQKAVRDSIGMFMDKDGDQSKVQAEISREMYSTKVRIDQILTKEQRQQLKDNSKRHQKQRKGKR